jgi:hypothetical protein
MENDPEEILLIESLIVEWALLCHCFPLSASLFVD